MFFVFLIRVTVYLNEMKTIYQQVISPNDTKFIGKLDFSIEINNQ